MRLLRKPALRAVEVALVLALAGCSLPRSGPTAREILAVQEQTEGDVRIVTVTPEIAELSRQSDALHIDAEFLNAPRLAPDTISAGDTLSITVWESVDAALLAGAGQKFTEVSAIQVDDSGRIFVPYVGRIKASGRRAEDLRVQITESLMDRTPDPQVEVRRVEGDGRTVSVLGAVREPGIYPIEAPTRRLSAIIARAGGVEIEPDVAQIKIIRRGREGRMWLQDLYDRASYDIALRAGDRIIVEQDRRAFTALGATEQQARVPFTKRAMSALEAVAVSSGLDGNAADPKGVFIFRRERDDIARRVTGEPTIVGPRRIAYLIDLTDPEGVFAAREFIIRDEDTIYVTESPFTGWRQILGVTSTAVSLGGSVAAISR